MVDAWEDAEGQLSSGEGLFIKLKSDGESMTCAFVGDPHVHTTTWPDGSQSARVAFRVFTPGQGVRIWDMSKRTFKTLKNIKATMDKRGRDFGSMLFEVTRVGTGTETTYQIMPDTALTAADQDELDSCEPVDLKSAIDGGGSRRAPLSGADQDVPF